MPTSSECACDPDRFGTRRTRELGRCGFAGLPERGKRGGIAIGSDCLAGMKFRCRAIIGDYLRADLRRTMEIGDIPKPGRVCSVWAQRKKEGGAESAKNRRSGRKARQRAHRQQQTGVCGVR